MATTKWNVPRSKSAFDISTTAIDEFVPPGHVPAAIRPLRLVQSVFDKREELLLSQTDDFHNTARRASEVPTGKPPAPQTQGVRRQSLFDKAINGTLKNDIKNLWARRSSLTLFKSKNSSPVHSDEESLRSSEESLDDLMKEMGGFFVVDRSAWAVPQPSVSAPPPKRRSFSLFGRKKD